MANATMTPAERIAAAAAKRNAITAERGNGNGKAPAVKPAVKGKAATKRPVVQANGNGKATSKKSAPAPAKRGPLGARIGTFTDRIDRVMLAAQKPLGFAEVCAKLDVPIVDEEGNKTAAGRSVYFHLYSGTVGGSIVVDSSTRPYRFSLSPAARTAAKGGSGRAHVQAARKRAGERWGTRRRPKPAPKRKTVKK